MRIQELLTRIDRALPEPGWDRDAVVQVRGPNGRPVWLPVVGADVQFVEGRFVLTIGAIQPDPEPVTSSVRHVHDFARGSSICSCGAVTNP